MARRVDACLPGLGEQKALLQEDPSPSMKCPLGASTPPRKRRKTPIDVETFSPIVQGKNKQTSESDSLSEIDIISEPDPQQREQCD